MSATDSRAASRRPGALGALGGLPGLSGVSEAAERLYRARRIGTTFGRVYLGLKGHQLMARHLAPPDMEARWNRLHASNARTIYETAIELRGLILKGCQFLGARADVLPRPYIEELSKLHDRVPPRSFRVVRRTVERELGQPLERVFRRFAGRPLASASLAQVHEAELRDGRRVAVKVQYPEIAGLVRSDLGNLRALFRAVGLLERDVDLMPLIDELGTYVPLELDFTHEGRNAETVAAMFEGRDDVLVPGIVWEHTTRRVLTMEFMEGVKITDVDALRAAGADIDRVVRTLVEAYCTQVLVHGFFNADPHPGNLLVQPEGSRLVLLDFGLSKDLPPRFRQGILRFTASLVRGEPREMVEAFTDLGFETRTDDRESLLGIARMVIDLANRLRERAYVDRRVIEEWNQELGALVRANPIVRVPGHVMLLGRALGLLSGVARSLGAEIDLLPVVLPYALGTRPGA